MKSVIYVCNGLASKSETQVKGKIMQMIGIFELTANS